MVETELTEACVRHEPSKTDRKILLFVVGDSPSARRARRAVEALLGRGGLASAALEVIDVLRAPDRALESNLFATPTLIVHDGGEISRYVGDLHDREDLGAVLSGEACSPDKRASPRTRLCSKTRSRSEKR